MAEIKQKSVPLAIGLNLVLPGLGYMYMGKIIVGIFALLLSVGIFMASGIGGYLLTWLSLNIIMAIDMLILGNKNKKDYEEHTTKQCPKCAELIKKEATVCKHCGADL